MRPRWLKNLHRFWLRHLMPSTFALLLVVIFLRRPDSLLNPQPWAEDGIFIQDALVNPINTILMPLSSAGYPQVVTRLVTVTAVSLSLPNAPLVMNLSALLLSAFSLSYFADTRFRKIVSSDLQRLVLCLFFACMPISDIFLNINNIQWFLLVYATLWVSDEWLNYRETSERRAFYFLVEGILAALAFLTSPISIILAPAVIILAARRVRDSGWTSVGSSIAYLACASLFLQTAIVHQASNGSLRISPVSFSSFATALSDGVVARLLAIDPASRVGHLLISMAGAWPVYLVSLSLLLPLAAAIARKKDITGIWFGALIISGLLFALTFRPLGWPAGRFAFLPMCLLLILIIRHIKTFNLRILKGFLLLLLLGVSFSFALHYRFAPFVDFNYKGYAAGYDPRGQWSLYAPINPPGWYMQLTYEPNAISNELKRTMTSTSVEGYAHVDSVGNSSVISHDAVTIDRSISPFIVVTGWAVAQPGTTVNAVYLVLDNDLAFPTAYGMSRPDISRLLGPQYQNSGWVGTLTVENLSGPHELFIWIVSNGNSYQDIDAGITIDVVG